jgi:hypothetical protein
LEVERASLQAWAQDRQGRVFDSGEDDQAQDRVQRRKVLGWIKSVLDVHATGRTGAAERARFSVLARLVHGRDIATAARGAGFASGRACLESFRSGRVWQRLGDAIGARVTARDQRLLASRRRAVALAMAAIKVQRASAAGAGRVEIGAPVARRFLVPSGAACVVSDGRTRNGKRVVRPAARRSIPARGMVGTGTGLTASARAWARATDERAAAVAMARAARVELQRARAQRLADFQAGTRGLRAGWLGGNGARGKV